MASTPKSQARHPPSGPQLDFGLSTNRRQVRVQPARRHGRQLFSRWAPLLARSRDMIGRLLGFDIAEIRSALLIPFPDPAGGFMDHVRMNAHFVLPFGS